MLGFWKKTCSDFTFQWVGIIMQRIICLNWSVRGSVPQEFCVKCLQFYMGFVYLLVLFRPIHLITTTKKNCLVPFNCLISSDQEVLQSLKKNFVEKLKATTKPFPKLYKIIFRMNHKKKLKYWKYISMIEYEHEHEHEVEIISFIIF